MSNTSAKQIHLPKYLVPFAANAASTLVVIHHAATEQTKSLMITEHTTAEQLIATIVEKFGAHWKLNVASKLVLRAMGSQEYLYGSETLFSYDYVSTCLRNGKEVHLFVMEHDSAMKECQHPVNEQYSGIEYAQTVEPVYDHDKIKFECNSWESMTVLSLWDMNRQFRCRVKALSAASFVSGSLGTIRIQIMIGDAILSEQTSKPFYVTNDAFISQSLVFPDILMSELPAEAIFCVTLFEQDKSVAFAKIPLFNGKRHLLTGLQKCALWESDKEPSARTPMASNPLDSAAILTIELDKFCLPVVCPTAGKIPSVMNQRYAKYEQEMSKVQTEKQQAMNIIEKDVLHKLTADEKWCIWQHRSSLKHEAKALGKFLQSVPWQFPIARRVAKDYLESWSVPVSPLDTLELLNYKYGASFVRHFAVKQLFKLSDFQVSDFLLQLVQALKFELHHDSALSRFLLQKAVQNNHLIGAKLFWMLKSEMSQLVSMERHACLLHEYLHTCPDHAMVLKKQNDLVECLILMSLKVKKQPTKEAQKKCLDEQLTQMKWPQEFCLPINPRIVLTGVNIAKCKVMGSKKMPLWLRFFNKDKQAPEFFTIFKTGDDLRQDILTLQLLHYMDQIWKAAKLDLHIKDYGCVSTGENIGFIQIVIESDTVASVTNDNGGSLAAMSNAPLKAFLEAHNSKSNWPTVVDNFAVSSAGYAVACYVLGIGDRHNDNIMLSERGDLFHIDFGHILGNYKTFAGVKRETTPFVFTPMYSHVMGGEKSATFQKFLQFGSLAFCVLRKHAHVLMSLFTFMLSCDIPELPNEDALLWLRRCLMLRKTDQQAMELFPVLAKMALANQRTRLNELVHIWVHNNIFK